MRVVGRRIESALGEPSAEALRRAAAHAATLAALSPISSTGVRKGVYRFATQAEAQAQIDAGRARVMAASAQRLAFGPRGR